jgi:hypothetical protein
MSVGRADALPDPGSTLTASLEGIASRPTKATLPTGNSRSGGTRALP